MGICVNKKKDKQIVYASKSILRPEKFDNTDFYFQSQNLLRIDADCLVLFCDEKMNLTKNNFLIQAGRHETRKVIEFAQAYMASNNIKAVVGNVILFPINIPTLRFKRVCLTCLKAWDGHEKIKENLEQIVESMFKAMVQIEITSVAITEFNEEFGIPIQLGCKIVVQALQKCKDKLKTITFVCNSVSSQTYFMQKIAQNKLELSSVYKESQQSSLSNYY